MITPLQIRLLLCLLFVASFGNLARAGVDLVSWEACVDQFDQRVDPNQKTPVILQDSEDSIQVSSGFSGSSTPGFLWIPGDICDLEPESRPHVPSEDCLFVKPIPNALLKVPIRPSVWSAFDYFFS